MRDSMDNLRNLGIAIALGVGIGWAMGVAFHQPATGAAIGATVGISAAALTLVNGIRRNTNS